MARAEETDRVSAAGYAMGYASGGVMLVINLWWILQPATFGFSSNWSAIKASFVAVAVWWAVFSLPLFRKVPEPAGETTGISVGVAFSRLGRTFSGIRRVTAMRS